jgi:hypothetical protein
MEHERPAASECPLNGEAEHGNRPVQIASPFQGPVTLREQIPPMRKRMRPIVAYNEVDIVEGKPVADS